MEFILADFQLQVVLDFVYATTRDLLLWLLVMRSPTVARVGHGEIYLIDNYSQTQIHLHDPSALMLLCRLVTNGLQLLVVLVLFGT